MTAGSLPFQHKVTRVTAVTAVTADAIEGDNHRRKSAVQSPTPLQRGSRLDTRPSPVIVAIVATTGTKLKLMLRLIS